jgi:hypothetical protein
MSPRGSKPKPAASEPGIYDGLLVVSCAALITGIIFLVLHLNNYGWQLS